MNVIAIVQQSPIRQQASQRPWITFHSPDGIVEIGLRVCHPGKMLKLPRAAELGLVTQVVPDQNLLATATETARALAAKPAAAVQASKRLMKAPLRRQLEQAVKLENEVFAERLDLMMRNKHSRRLS